MGRAQTRCTREHNVPAKQVAAGAEGHSVSASALPKLESLAEEKHYGLNVSLGWAWRSQTRPKRLRQLMSTGALAISAEDEKNILLLRPSHENGCRHGLGGARRRRLRDRVDNRRASAPHLKVVSASSFMTECAGT